MESCTPVSSDNPTRLVVDHNKKQERRKQNRQRKTCDDPKTAWANNTIAGKSYSAKIAGFASFATLLTLAVLAQNAKVLYSKKRDGK